ncbi:MAG: hypothetical protein JWN76_3645 [Chitinophagaceae bacterium]|nr:hypothetical protein [Chitinophagaceae bacterium]
MKRLIFLFLYLIVSISVLQAQLSPTYNSADIYRSIQKLKVLGTVLYFAAHPDDENTRLLAYLSKEKQYRTGYLSLTRGDGGQNLIGNEQGIDLGLIRTQELLAARRIDGAEQFFSRAYDFGFSKTADETLSFWGHDEILADAVWIIRNFRPDVIITRFPGDSRAGHGHHWSSALIAKEAFTAAADPNKFPEQLKNGITTWQAKRLLWNTFNFNSANNTTSEDQFKMDVGDYNAMMGKGYGEIASESRSQHKSQGFGVARQRGRAIEYFQTTAGSTPVTDLMDGVNTSWTRAEVQSLDKKNEEVQSRINDILQTYNYPHPEASTGKLVALYQFIQTQTEGSWKQQKLSELQDIILAANGIFAEAVTDNRYAVQDQSSTINFNIIRRSDTAVALKEVRLTSFDTTLNYPLPFNQLVNMKANLVVTKDAAESQPYWLQQPIEGAHFNVKDQLMIGRPQNNPALSATFILNIHGKDFFVQRPVSYKYTDPVKGELYQPLTIITPAFISLSPGFILTGLRPGNEYSHNPFVQVNYQFNFTKENVPVSIKLLQQNKTIFTSDTLMNVQQGRVYTSQIPLARVSFQSAANPVSAILQVDMNGSKKMYSSNLRTIAYDHIPEIHYFYRDETRVITDEIKTAGKNIGYFNGAGDKVAQALIQMGYDVRILEEKDLTADNLKTFDAIITGVRAYNTHEALADLYPVLMQYVKGGGNLIVQYNVNNISQKTRNNFSPYPLTITSRRVTEENAAVDFLLPNHPVLNYPNKITTKDFDNWIQERSIYHAEQLDPHYEAPLSMHDLNEPASNGSLVIAKYGKGNFVYTGLVLFRELPAGVPGAFKLLANLIALPKNNE